jgi:hypothetical protein
MSEVGRGMVALVHERQVEATLAARITPPWRTCSGRRDAPGPSPAAAAIAFVDLAGFTSLTEELGDEAAATAAARLFDIAEYAVRCGGRVVKQLGDGVLLRFPDGETAVRVARIVGGMDASGLPPPTPGSRPNPWSSGTETFPVGRQPRSRMPPRRRPERFLVEEGVVVALPRGTGDVRAGRTGRVEGLSRADRLWRAVAPDRVRT